MEKTRNFKNIKMIEAERLDEIMDICFTYSVHPQCKVKYMTNKGKNTSRYFKTLPFKAQQEFLIKGIMQLNKVAYYFEKHKDGRYHIHAYCRDTPRHYLQYAKDRYNDTKMLSRADLQDFCLLGEVVASIPSWVEYCLKEQEARPVFIGDIEEYENNKLDAGIVKINVNPKIYIDEFKILPSSERNFDNYLHNDKKRFLVEI